MAKKMTTAETEDGRTIAKNSFPGDTNRAAGEHYLEVGEVPVVQRGDDKDAGVASVYASDRGFGGLASPITHHGSDIMDARQIERRREMGLEVGLIDLENGEVLVEPTTERQFEEGRAAPTVEEVRERFGAVTDDR